MVLDPFSALGLASNVVQFVDYASRVVSKSVEQYESAAGCSRELVDTEAVAQHLGKLAQSLERDLEVNRDGTGLQRRRKLGQTFKELLEASDEGAEQQGRRTLTQTARRTLQLSTNGPELQSHHKFSQIHEGNLETTDSALELQQLAMSCHTTAVELIEMVNGLKLDPKLRGAKRRIQSLRQALRVVGKENRIRALERSLGAYRSQITLQIAVLTQ